MPPSPVRKMCNRRHGRVLPLHQLLHRTHIMPRLQQVLLHLLQLLLQLPRPHAAPSPTLPRLHQLMHMHAHRPQLRRKCGA